jgi:hypothetical protein
MSIEKKAVSSTGNKGCFYAGSNGSCTIRGRMYEHEWAMGGLL